MTYNVGLPSRTLNITQLKRSLSIRKIDRNSGRSRSVRDSMAYVFMRVLA